MKKIKKIKIRVNGKVKSIPANHSISDFVKNLNITSARSINER